MSELVGCNKDDDEIRIDLSVVLLWISYEWKLAPQIAPSFVQSTEQVKPPRHSVQPVETSIPAATPKRISPKSNRSDKRKNKRTCFVCKSMDHLIKDYDYHAKKKAQPTPRNYAHRVLTQSKPIFNTTVRPISAAVPKIMVTRPRHAHSLNIKSNLTIRRHKTRSPSPKTSNSPPKVTAVKAPVVSVAQGMNGKWNNIDAAQPKLMLLVYMVTTAEVNVCKEVTTDN
nr:hypothetical protein [Tanacetum cinerariifolium]